MGDAARALQLSQDRVTRLLNQGVLGGIRWGNRLFLTADDIEAFQEQRYGGARMLCERALHTADVRLTPNVLLQRFHPATVKVVCTAKKMFALAFSPCSFSQGVIRSSVITPAARARER